MAKFDHPLTVRINVVHYIYFMFCDICLCYLYLAKTSQQLDIINSVYY